MRNFPVKFPSCSALVCSFLALALLASAQNPNTGSPAASASAQVPRLIRFSGIAKDETGKPSTGVVGITFSLYTDEQGGAPLWVETQNVRADESGHYTVMLGSASADGVPLSLFSSAEAHWISTQVSGQPEQPRVLLLSVPYALKAADAETLGGLPASAFMHASAGGAQGKSGSSASSSTQPNLPPAGVTGKGTKDFVPMWTGATALGNSLIYQTGGSLGIGTKTPKAEVDVVGKGVLGIEASVPGTQAAISGIATAVSGGTTGTYGQSSDPQGNGVFGMNNASSGGAGVIGVAKGTSGSSWGVQGQSASTSGIGVSGNASSTTGQVYGVEGTTNSTTGNSAGVNGFEGATTGAVYGVFGLTKSTSGVGVAGVTTSTSGTTTGVVGQTSSSGDGSAGVFGGSSGTSGVTFGVHGVSNSASGATVGGVNNAASGGTAIYGQANATTGSALGVYGQSASTSGVGVTGNAFATSGVTFGVTGFSASSSGIGVQASNTATTGVVALAGPSPYLIQAFLPNFGAFAVDNSGNGFFGGNLNVTGKLTKGSGSFKIDHPLDPANKYLSHSFVESPDMMNVYNGVVLLDAHGSAWVTLPDYFEALNRDYRYQLTALGVPGPNLYIARKVLGNRFKIAGGKPHAEVSWQVTGIRQDAYANAYRIPIEEDKPTTEQGYYLHPELFGQPESKSVAMAHKSASSQTMVADALRK